MSKIDNVRLEIEMLQKYDVGFVNKKVEKLGCFGVIKIIHCDHSFVNIGITTELLSDFSFLRKYVGTVYRRTMRCQKLEPDKRLNKLLYKLFYK